MSPSDRPRVLVSRSPHQASELAELLRAVGLEPILIPAIELAEPTSYAVLDHALANLDNFHWLLFTSANAVEAFRRRRPDSAARFTQQVSAAKRPRIAAIGPSTARALQSIGLTADLVPPQAIAESLAEVLLPYAHQSDGTPTRVLLIRAEEGREILPETLRRSGAVVTVAPAYRTVLPEGSIPSIRSIFERSRQASRPVNAITFTSSSSARNLLALCEAAGVGLPETALRASIGPITSATLRDLGYPPHIEAPAASIEALAQAVWSALRHGAAPALRM